MTRRTDGRWRHGALALVAAGTLAACAPQPTVPHVMVYPGRGKSLYEFDADDANCRSWAASRIEASPQQAATDSTVGGAAIGTILGGAAGASCVVLRLRRATVRRSRRRRTVRRRLRRPASPERAPAFHA